MLNNNKMSDISVKGVVLNLLSVGFSTIASICEFIDNSLGAKASEINIKLTNNHFTYWDNGEGMNIEKLKEGHIIANRSESSITKHGRFGVGDKHAKAHLTQLQYKTLTISKTVPCEGDDALNQVVADWPAIIEEDKYIVAASDISCRNISIWNKHARHLECGTLQHLECHEKIAREIKDNIETNEITSSYLYSLGVSYYNDLKDDFRITVDINSSEYDVIAIDPLEWDKIPEINKKETTMEVMSNNVLLLSLDGQEGFYEIYADRAGRKHSRFYSLNDIKSLQDQTANGIEETEQKINGKRFSGYPVNKTFSKEGYEKISSITLRSVYHPDWTDLQSYVYEHIGQPILNQEEKETIEDESDNTPIENEKKKNQDTFNYMGGEYYTRNGRRIKRFDTDQPKRGDKARYPFQTNSRHEIMFTAEIDDKMGVLVNKSDLKKELILPDFSTIFEVLKKQFVDEQYKLSIKTVNPVKSQIKQPQNVTKPPTTDVESSVLASSSIIDSIETTQTLQIISNANETNISIFDEEEEIVAESNESLLEPKIVPVGPKNDTTITINQGNQIIKKWFDNETKNTELESILNEMIKKYQDRSAPDQIDLLLSEMSLTQKYNIIVKSIQFRYPNESVYDTTNMLFGAELWRSYTESLPQTP